MGKRLAGRIVLELREKVAAAGSAVAAGAPRGAAAGPTEREVVAALQALGYTLAEAREAARSGAAAAPGATLEDRVKAALRAISAPAT